MFARRLGLRRWPVILSPGMAPGMPDVFELLMQFVQLLVGHFLKVHQLVAGAFDGSNQLIQLEMHGARVAVLGVLNQEHHQERDDGCPRVDDQLPCVREVEYRPRDRPSDNHQARQGKHPGGTGQHRNPVCESPKSFTPALWLMLRLVVVLVLMFVIHDPPP